MLSGSVSPGALVDSGVGEVDFSADQGMVKVHRRVAQAGFVSRFVGSIAVSHWLLAPFFAEGRVTYRQYLTQARVKVGAGRAPVPSLRGFHASSSGSVVPLAGEKAFL